MVANEIEVDEVVNFTDAHVEFFCEVMHDAYEKAATGEGWVTNPASRKPWADVPSVNQNTMRAAVRALLSEIEARGGRVV